MYLCSSRAGLLPDLLLPLICWSGSQTYVRTQKCTSEYKKAERNTKNKNAECELSLHRNNFNHGTVIPRHTYRLLRILEGSAEENHLHCAPFNCRSAGARSNEHRNTYIRECPRLSSRAGGAILS